MTNYFTNCTTAEQLKAEYKKLAKQLHPDMNPNKDTTAEFQAMQAEFEKMYSKIGNIHENANGQQYTKESTQTAPEFMAIINLLLSLSGIEVEMCGSWIWCTGDTKPHKDILKANGFKWSKQKVAWYYHEGQYFKFSKRQYSMDNIREMWGSEKFEKRTANHKQLARA